VIFFFYIHVVVQSTVLDCFIINILLSIVNQVVDPVCHQLFDFYRTLNVELQRFTMELVPVLVWTYLFAVSYSDKKVMTNLLL
jgi:hypothetical protein